MAYCMRRLRGAYSLAVMTKDALLGIRDPLGVRPLCIGKLNGGWVIASESCALDHIGAEFVREVAPGEAVMADDEGLRTVYQRQPDSRAGACIFEHIYFARPDSILNEKLVYSNRMEMGAELAREHPVDADMVIGVPDSATAAARGLLARVGDSLRRGTDQEPLRGAHVHPSRPEAARPWRPHEAQPAAATHQRQAACRRGRQYRARHDHSACGKPAKEGRSQGGPPADLCAAHHIPLSLWR